MSSLTTSPTHSISHLHSSTRPFQLRTDVPPYDPANPDHHPRPTYRSYRSTRLPTEDDATPDLADVVEDSDEGIQTHRRIRSSANSSRHAIHMPDSTNQSNNQLRQFLALSTHNSGYFSSEHSDHRLLPGLPAHPRSSQYGSFPSTPGDGFYQSRRQSRVPARSSRSIHGNWTQSLRIPDWVSVHAPSQGAPTAPATPVTQRVDRKGGYDAEFKTELAGPSGNGMRVWYDTYTSVDWLHEHVKQSIRKKHLNRIRGPRGQLKRFWDKSQGWVLVTLIGISTALMAGLIVSLEMWLFDLKEGYCANRWTSPKRFCCAPPPASSLSDLALNATQIPQSFIQSFKLLPFDGFSTNPGPRGSPFAPSSFITQWATRDLVTTTHSCSDWKLWTDVLNASQSSTRKRLVEFAVYLFVALSFAGLSSLMTVYLSSSESVQSTKDRAPGPSPTISPQAKRRSESNSDSNHSQPVSQEPSPYHLPSKLPHRDHSGPKLAKTRPPPLTETSSLISTQPTIVPDGQPYAVNSTTPLLPPRIQKVAYFAAGSGIPEIKCILSGFVIRGYLGTWTMLTKSFGLALSVASGLSLGKEGPLVHIASCIGNIFTRCFKKFDRNEAKRREVLSAACAAGVSVAFGAPIGGVLFSLEEVSYFFPPRVMWRSCWCAMVAAATLRVLDPFKTGKTVLFEVTYDRPWHFFEFGGFIFLGLLGGILGAWFAQANVWWTQNIRKRTWLHFHPIAEVLLVTFVTILLGFSNPYLKMGGSELVYEMLAECPSTAGHKSTDPCLHSPSQTGRLIATFAAAAALKFLTTVVTFGIKCPAGIFVPSLAVGALLGRILGLAVEHAFYLWPNLAVFGHCAAALSQSNGFGQACVLPGVWAMVGAAAMLAGVTRTTVSLVVIVAELTGSLVYILPIAISVLVAKTTADAIESRSIYDLVIEASDLPYLDAKSEYIHSAMPSDIMDEAAVVICVEDRLRVSDLRLKAGILAGSNSAGGFPLVSRDETGERIVGYVGRGELEHGIGSIASGVLAMDPVVMFEGDGELMDEESEEEEEAPLSPERAGLRRRWGRRGEEEEEQAEDAVVDLSHLVDHAPVAVSVRTPMELLHEMFVRLGVRYLVIQDERGLYLGIIERNRWLRYLRWVEHRAHSWSTSVSSSRA